MLRVVDDIFFQFLWNSNVNKIAKKTVISSIEHGGFKMIDIYTKVKTLKIAWIRRAILNPNSVWKLIIDESLGDLTFDYAVRCTGLSEHYKLKIPIFYRDIVQHLSTLRSNAIENKNEIICEPLWLNNQITIENKPIIWKKWLHKGIKYVNDLLDPQGHLLSLDDFNARYNINCSFLDHMRIRQAIPSPWRRYLAITNTHPDINTSSIPFYITDGDRNLNMLKAPSKDIYWICISNLTRNHQPSCIQKWESIYDIDPGIWPQLFVASFRACRETRLQSFQYRVIHRTLPCNDWLFVRKIVPSNTCSYKYCEYKGEIDTLKHYLVTCSPVQAFWQSYVTWWNSLEYSNLFPLVEENIFLGFPCNTNEDSVLNFTLIVAKSHIYSCKRKQKSIFFLEYLAIVKDKLCVEENINSINGTNTKFNHIWGYLQDTL